MRPLKTGIGLKMALLCSVGLFITLSLLFHFSFDAVQQNLLAIIKGDNLFSVYKTEELKKAFSDNRMLFIVSTTASIALSMLVVMFVFNRLVKGPLNSLIRVMEEIDRGNLTATVPVRGTDEIAQLSERFNQMLSTLASIQAKMIEEYVHEKIVIVDSIPVGVVIVGYDKKVLFANQAIMDMLEKDLEEMIEEDFPFAIAPGIIKEYQINSSSGLPKVVEMQSLPVEWQKTSAYLVLLIDVTRLKAVQKELKEAKEKAETATMAKSLFLANMSHEIRTPMNAIMGMTDILLDTNLPEDQRSCIKTIKTASDALLKIINDILDLSKIESGKMILESISFRLEGLIDDTLWLFMNQAVAKGIDLRRQIDEDVPLGLIGDPLRLRQVLHNLLSNAIKFTEKGEVLITVKKVKDNQTKVGDWYHMTRTDIGNNKVMLLFCVRDTGIGIPYALQEKVFDSFTQVDSSITRRYGGTGLGLAICKEIVKLMKGTIWVESEYGSGSSFFFTALFTVAMDASPLESAADKERVKDACKPIGTDRKVRALVAEDDRLNQKVLSMVLKKNGIDFVIAENGREVIERLEQVEQGPFDIILMDIQMPEMDGLETTKRIRTSSSGLFNPKIPIVAVTAFAMKEDMQRCLEAGMDDYISKPINADKLMKILSRLLRDKSLPNSP